MDTVWEPGPGGALEGRWEAGIYEGLICSGSGHASGVVCCEVEPGAHSGGLRLTVDVGAQGGTGSVKV